jgi:prevent-host-death family protein
MRVGTKELKNRLSHYLRLARAGEQVLVTDRGKAVAELRGLEPTASTEDELLRDLAARGLVTLGRGQPGDFTPVALASGALLSRAIVEDRE